jgi:drug/metabolite transporter (DMT)-like permease
MKSSYDQQAKQTPTSLLFLIPAIALTLLAFAGNSLLTRAAMQHSQISETLFTAIRISSGALVLCLLLALRDAQDGSGMKIIKGQWMGAIALLAYALGFTLAYRSMSAATGALILFAVVQATMIGWSVAKGKRLHWSAWLGLLLAMTGLVLLLLPGLHTPPWHASLLMTIAGIAWGVYSILGQTSSDPLATTAGNFLRATPIAIALALLAALISDSRWDMQGVVLAVISGGITSGLGYALWYRVLPLLASQTSASLQLSVPLITALGGMWWLGEAPSLRLWLASAAIIAGIGLVIQSQRRG